jgi:hypothetical protein
MFKGSTLLRLGWITSSVMTLVVTGDNLNSQPGFHESFKLRFTAVGATVSFPRANLDHHPWSVLSKSSVFVPGVYGVPVDRSRKLRESIFKDS